MRDLHEKLQPVLQVLKQWDGYFVFRDEEGDEFVVMPKEALEMDVEHEEQLALPAVPPRAARSTDSAEAVIEKINRDIASYRVQQVEEDFDDLEITEEELQQTQSTIPLPPVSDTGKRVRFEPIKGDLAPELQD